MNVDMFDFSLPRDLIASRPAKPRDSARLLEMVTDNTFEDSHIYNLPDILLPGDLLVVNNTRVIPARLIGYRNTARVTITLYQQQGVDQWLALAKPASRLVIGHKIDFSSGNMGEFSATVSDCGKGGTVLLRFNLSGLDLKSAIDYYGRIPLPPYIRRQPDSNDETDYQTLFADNEGSIASPTAGLHFTPSLLSALKARGVSFVPITLHIGIGTFMPVRVGDTINHTMHAEFGVITSDAATIINRRQGRLIAVGTTTLRLLESAVSENGILYPFSSKTALFITPGHRFRSADVLLTNFHLPRSTLFMLVSAFSGLRRTHAAYTHAITACYRFCSYGDACLISRKAKKDE